MKVLFVDDEEELVSALVERLGIRGIDAHGAATGSDALELIENGSFDVVVADVKMPGLGGLDVVRIAREKHPDLKIILLSGHGSHEDAEEGARLGAFDYVQKPIDIEVLIEILHKAAASQ